MPARVVKRGRFFRSCLGLLPMKHRNTAATAVTFTGRGASANVRMPRALVATMLAALGLFASAATARPHGIAALTQPHGGAQFFSDRAAFTAALGVPAHLAVETFDNGQPVGPFPTTCSAPFSSTTNNTCFLPGQIVPGFALTSSSGGDLVDVPPSFFGPLQSTRVVGASSFADATIATFTPAANAAAATVYGGINTATYVVDVEAFDAGGNSLGSVTLDAGDSRDSSVFLGIVSTTPIDHIAFNGADDGGELIDNLTFRAAGLAPPGLALAFSPSEIAAGNTSTLTITLGNQAQPGVATLSAALVDTLPAGVLIAPTPNATTDCAAGTLTALAGTSTITLAAGAQIPAGATCTIKLDVIAASAGLYANTIALGALQTTLGNSQDAASASLTVSSGQTGTFPPSEDFDGVFAPALPAGWVTSTSTGANDWTTQTVTVDSAPNAATSPDLGTVSDLTLDSPAFTAAADQTVTFRHRYNLERGFDGGVLEISIDGGEFSDIVSAGGRFITGGYAGVTISEFTGNPIGGRPAWTGDSAEFVTTVARLPDAAAGHATRLRFRNTADAGNLNTGEVRGWWIDSIHLGIDVQAPQASTTPASLAFTVAANGSATLPLSIHNAGGSDPLTFAIESRNASRPQLVPYATFAKAKKTLAGDSKPLVPRPLATLSSHGDGTSHAARTLPWAPQGSLMLALDDGSAESSVGTGTGSFNPPTPFTEQAAVWINRFHASDALTIHSISVFWPEPSMAGGDLLGLQANLVVYYDVDGDGDPRNAVRVGTDTLVTVTATGDFVAYPTTFNVPAAGDVYIGFVDQWALAGGFMPRLYPAAVDESSPQGMSYYSSVDTPPVDASNLANNTYTDFFNDANLMIRATVTGGGGGAPCSGPAVTWLSATPTGTTIDGGDSAIVAVTVDAAAGGLAEGVYHADLCITTNDPANLLMAVPVSVTVGNPPPPPCAAADELFCDGFDHAAAAGNIVSGTIDQAVTDSGDGSAFDFTSGDYHPYSGAISTDDVNLYDFGDGSLTAYWYGDFVPAPLQAGGVADANGDIMVLHSGDTVGPASTVGGSTIMTNWLGGVDGYIGVVFYNESTSALNYGYVHLVTTGPLGFPAQVHDWAYDNSGAAITIP